MTFGSLLFCGCGGYGGVDLFFSSFFLFLGWLFEVPFFSFF